VSYVRPDYNGGCTITETPRIGSGVVCDTITTVRQPPIGSGGPIGGYNSTIRPDYNGGYTINHY